jgi:predicted phosphoribosyltransferase
MIFEGREEAGFLLSELISQRLHKLDDPIIMSIPRGGVPVGFVISKELEIPMSIVVVRKLGLPWNEEAGFGAIDPEGSTYLDEDVVESAKLDIDSIRKIADREFKELKRRERLFLPNGYPRINGRGVVIVDDGIATGYTAIAACGFCKRKGAKSVLVAVPVCPGDSAGRFKDCAEEFICYHKGTEFHFAVGMYYRNFKQLTDDEVLEYINKARELELFEP